METAFVSLTERPRYYRAVGCVCVFFVIHIAMMSVILVYLGDVAPEIKTTLSDVNVILPEMRRSLGDLGQILPEIKLGMAVLEQLCNESPNCSYVL